jgi:hypothetical protein
MEDGEDVVDETNSSPLNFTYIFCEERAIFLIQRIQKQLN